MAGQDMAGRDCACCATSASSTQGATAAYMMDRLLSYRRMFIGRLDGLVKSLCEQVVSGFVLLLHLVSHGFARWTSPSFLRQRLDHEPMPSAPNPNFAHSLPSPLLSRYRRRALRPRRSRVVAGCQVSHATLRQHQGFIGGYGVNEIRFVLLLTN